MFPKGARSHLRRVRRGRTALPLLQSLEPRALLSTIHVDTNAPGATQDGSSWDTAYRDLQAALAVATAGDEIRVADGVYKPTSGTDRTISFQLKSGVSLRGGFAGYGADIPDELNFVAYATVLSGDLGTNSFSDDSAHVVNASGVDSSTVLAGFIITRGNANLGLSGSVGGGIYNDGGAPQIVDCVITNNRADDGGGGMFNLAAKGVELVRCTFSSNSASRQGGGIGNVSSEVRLIACSFNGNGVGAEGANTLNNSDSEVELLDCYFTGNGSLLPNIRNVDSSVVSFVRASYIDTAGPGISNESGSSLTVTDSIFRRNTTGFLISNNAASMTLSRCEFLGNGMHFRNTSGSAIVTDCIFSSNSLSGFINTSASGTFTRCTFRRSGGMTNIASSPTVVNCVFEGDRLSNSDGSAPLVIQCSFTGSSNSLVSNSTSATPTFINCTFSGDGLGGIGIIRSENSSPTLINCIVWGRSSGSLPVIVQNGGTANITYSNIEGGFAGTGNINVNPQFVRNPSRGPDNTWGTSDDDYGVVRVKANSPCIDVGSNAAVPGAITTDPDGKPRIVDVPGVQPAGAIVDMGTHESPAPLLAVKGEYLYDDEVPTVSMSFNFELFDPSFITPDLWILDPATGLGIYPISHSLPFYDADLRRVRRAFFSPLPDGNYLGRMYSGGVQDHRGAMLAETYVFEFYVLAGDANRDRKVDAKDLMILAANWMGTGKRFSQGDFNYDTVVDYRDLGILASRWQLRLDAPLPSAPIPTSSPLRSPARTPTRVMALVEPTP